MNKQKEILIIGKIPPPIGGVTIHLQRLTQFLKLHSINFDFIDYANEPIFSCILKFLKSKIIHSNFSNKLARLISTLICRTFNKKVIITFHGKYSFENYFDYLSLKYATFNFVLNEYSYKNAIAKGRNGSKVKLISAFIPPDEHEDVLNNEMESRINCFIRGKEIIACTNAHNYVTDKNGKDLYGIDFLLNIFKQIPEASLIISDPSGKLIKKYSEFKFSKNILFISEPHSFVEIIKRSNVFIRATTSDGDSLSIKEALYFGIKVIASDCIDRPLGSKVYKTGNQDSFFQCLFDSTSEPVSDIVNGAIDILKVYKAI